MHILELNKILIYELHYHYIKNRCDNKSKLLFTDTDSFIYGIKILAVKEICLILVTVQLSILR